MTDPALPFWLPADDLAPILAQVSDAGYEDVQTVLERDDIMLVTATGEHSRERHVIRCKALRDFADVLHSLDKRERKARLRGPQQEIA